MALDRIIAWSIAFAFACAWAGTSAANAAGQRSDPPDLTLRPRVCTLSKDDERCETTVRAQWRSARDESLCLVIVGHPHVKRCWDGFSEGRYSIELAFDQDLVVELRDRPLENVLASATLTIIREALQFRRKRRQPWNILY